jgi:uncharacterized repeat protein (TIGR03803 family)
MKPNSIVRFAGALACASFLHVSAAGAATETVLYSFGSNAGDGTNPQAGLIDVGGTLYGTTTDGGTNDNGTVFSINPTTGAETVVWSFGSGSDGTFPYAGLIDVGGTLYGTTTDGGTNDNGTVFSINPTTGAETVVWSFGSGSDGTFPYAGLIGVRGTLYGTTYEGGTGTCTRGGNNVGCGTVFSINPTTGAETVLYSFTNGNYNGSYGALPKAGLIDVRGILYGTTYEGGPGTCVHGGDNVGCGTVFTINPTTGREQTQDAFFGGPDGNYPEAGLTVGSRFNVVSTFYGTTSEGGTGTGCRRSGCGTVFLSATTGTEKRLYSFCSQTSCSDGANPQAGLIDVNGTLYGTTAGGGANGGGTVFSIDSMTAAETVLYSFCSQPSCTDGEYPRAGLIDIGGTLYGTTAGGGANGDGTVFSITP